MRIPVEKGVIAESVAEVRPTTVSDLIRGALDKFLEEVLHEPGFMAEAYGR